MIVYYIADKEKPSNKNGVRFFLSHNLAMAAAQESRQGVYQFEVNDKCDTESFGLDTIMVFKKDEAGLRFIASGNWLEIHEILNLPFYKDFEENSSYFTMSLKYFNTHYNVVEKSLEEQVKKAYGEPLVKSEVESKPKEKPKVKKEKQVVSEQVDTDVIDILFGDA